MCQQPGNITYIPSVWDTIYGWIALAHVILGAFAVHVTFKLGLEIIPSGDIPIVVFPTLAVMVFNLATAAYYARTTKGRLLVVALILFEIGIIYAGCQLDPFRTAKRQFIKDKQIPDEHLHLVDDAFNYLSPRGRYLVADWKEIASLLAERDERIRQAQAEKEKMNMFGGIREMY